ncbi:expressed protein [Phakopsora pachyrhizi]|uniref:Expressed protein n=1 Tax=Phakopsora pachyrhizi TaxID=170000 RepID=A0AAV0BNX9_PHAPC|nr:expressed protein [Phakopsora pachyrhizi]
MSQGGVEITIILSFILCLYSILSLTSNLSIYEPTVALLRDITRVIKLFGIAFLVLVLIILGIAIWECVIPSPRDQTSDEADHEPEPKESQDRPRKVRKYIKRKRFFGLGARKNNAEGKSSSDDNRRSLAPIIFVVLGILLISLIDMSILLAPIRMIGILGSSSFEPHNQSGPHHHYQDSIGFNFSTASLMVGLVVGSIVLLKLSRYRSKRSQKDQNRLKGLK